MTRNLWAVPDIHGRSDLLQLLLARLYNENDLDLERDKLIFMGDMVDRGPDSRGVLTIVRGLVERHPERVIALYGNHEDLMVKGCEGDHEDLQLWHWNGGGKTLQSYPDEMVPSSTLQWLLTLPLYHEEPGFFFSHAPVPSEEHRGLLNRGKAFTKHELTWTYIEGLPEGEMGREHGNGVIGVCGHIHRLRYGVKEPRLYAHYIFADAGCGCSQTAPLVAIEVKRRQVVFARVEDLFKAVPTTTKPDWMEE